MVAILAALLLPTLSRGRAEALGVNCFSNLRQFSLAWMMYVEDWEERIPPNQGSDNKPDPVVNTWVRGWMDCAIPDWRDNTNTEYLRASLIGPYLHECVGIWRCPADYSSARFGEVMLPRVRSYAMNGYLNSIEDPPEPYKHIRKLADMVNPSPAKTFVFIDEREDSVEDCYFGVDMYNGDACLTEIPRSSHNGRGTLSFADGHVELHKWIDPRSEPPLRPGAFVAVYWTEWPPNPDVLWLRERTTGLK